MARTAAELIALATQIAKCPGYTGQAASLLNGIQDDLAETYDFAVARGLFTFNFDMALLTDFGSGPYPLPLDYLRTSGSSGSYGAQRSAWWVLLGVPYPMIPCDLAEFDMQVQQAGLQSYPWLWATDMSQRYVALSTIGDLVPAPPPPVPPPPSSPAVPGSGGGGIPISGGGTLPTSGVTPATPGGTVGGSGGAPLPLSAGGAFPGSGGTSHSLVPGTGGGFIPGSGGGMVPGSGGSPIPGSGGLPVTPVSQAPGVIQNLPTTDGIVIGMQASGPGIPPLAVVTAIGPDTIPGSGGSPIPGSGGGGLPTSGLPANAVSITPGPIVSLTGSPVMFGYGAVGYAYPPPSGAYPVYIRYQRDMPDLPIGADGRLTGAGAATIPWFPNFEYLKTRLAADLMGITDDQRQGAYEAEALAILNRYLKMKDDDTNRAKIVTLDRRVFGPAFRSLRNTKVLGW